MIDIQSLVFGPVYSAWGVGATITPVDGSPVSVRVIDRTAGVDVAGNADVPTIRPAALVRVSELTAAGLTRSGIRRAEVVMNGTAWRVERTELRPTHRGEADGELLMVLIEAPPPAPPPPEEPEEPEDEGGDE